MDRFMGCVDNELASITGLELTVAPRRPAHQTHKCDLCTFLPCFTSPAARAMDCFLHVRLWRCPLMAAPQPWLAPDAMGRPSNHT